MLLLIPVNLSNWRNDALLPFNSINTDFFISTGNFPKSGAIRYTSHFFNQHHNRVLVNISQKCLEISHIVHWFTLKTLAEQMTVSWILVIEIIPRIITWYIPVPDACLACLGIAQLLIITDLVFLWNRYPSPCSLKWELQCRSPKKSVSRLNTSKLIFASCILMSFLKTDKRPYPHWKLLSNQ